LEAGEGRCRELFAEDIRPKRNQQYETNTMKIKLFSLTLASVCSLPLAGFTQGTYLSAPDGNPTNAAVVAPGGNVGIGTTSPTAQVDVRNGNRRVSINQDWFSQNNINAGGVLALSRPDDGSLSFMVGGSESPVDDMVIYAQGGGSEIRLVSQDQGFGFYKVPSIDAAFSSNRPPALVKITGTGNVGIGTADPQGKFEIVNDGFAAILRHPTSSSWTGIAFYEGTGMGQNYIQSIGSDFSTADRRNNLEIMSGRGAVVLVTANTDRLIVDRIGNVGIGTTTPSAKLDVAGKVNCTVLELTSDRAQKSGFAPVDCGAMLAEVARLPLSTWHYTNETSVTHIGPMAQDFQAAFRVGSDDKHIATVDADGVALAAIQALNDKVEALVARVATLEKENVRLRASETAALQKPRNLGQ
jgi:hypothetical protein